MAVDEAELASRMGDDAVKAAQVKEAARFYIEKLAEEDAAAEAQEQMAKDLMAMPSVSADEENRHGFSLEADEAKSDDGSAVENEPETGEEPESEESARADG